MNKECIVCNKTLPLSSFRRRIRKNGKEYFYPYCLECQKIQDTNYRVENKEEISDRRKRQYAENSAPAIQRAAAYYLNNKEILADVKVYQGVHKEQLKVSRRAYKKNRKINDPFFKLKERMSSAIYLGLKSNGVSKGGKSIIEYLPYSIRELKEHLEKQFESWMTWNNYGMYNAKTWDDNDLTTWTWNIDHIIPQSIFRYTSMSDINFQECWSLSNLRPLSSKTNRIKSDKVISC
jgi:hypothetical protein